MDTSIGRQYSLISQLSFKIEKISETVQKLQTIKEKAIQALESKKEELGDDDIADIVEKQGEIEDQLQKVVEAIDKEKEAIETKKLSYDERVQEIQEIEREIGKLRRNLVVMIADLNQKKKSIRENLKIIENLDKRIRDVTQRILKEKGIILSELSEEEKKTHKKNLKNLEKEREELLRQREEFIEGMSLDWDQTHYGLLDELRGEMEFDTLSLDLIRQAELLLGKKWDDMTQEEKLRALLQLRGLRLTPSGRIQTLSGRILTLEELAAMFEGIDLEDLLKLYPVYGEPTEEKAKKDEISCPIVSSGKSESTTSLKASTETSHSSRESVLTGMSSEDVHYLKENLGKALISAIAEITAKQPRDPIHYLGQWLFKYRLNEENDVVQKKEIEALIEERERLMKEKLNKMFEEEARAFVLEAIVRAEERAIQNQIEAQLRRIAMETAMLENEEELYEEARDVMGVYNGPPAGQSLL